MRNLRCRPGRCAPGERQRPAAGEGRGPSGLRAAASPPRGRPPPGGADLHRGQPRGGRLSLSEEGHRVK